MAIHQFRSTGDAYDACQCDDTIQDGDTLVIMSEGVVGIADTWPVAVTVAAGKLHIPADGMSLAHCLENRVTDAAVSFARDHAVTLGFAVRD